jgi:hypothetical protein
MADIAEFAKLLAKSGYSPEDYKSVFESINPTSSSAAAAGGGGSKSVKAAKAAKVSKKEAEAASVPGSDPASPTRLSSQYKVKLRVIIAERHGVKSKVDQDKILDKFNKEWLKSKHPENYQEYMKYTEDVAKEFIAEMFPAKAPEEEAESEEEEEEQVSKKTIDIEGKPTTVWHNESNGNVYNDKEELIGKLDDGKFTAN